MKLTSKIAATFAVLALASTAQAALISGQVGFGLIATLDSQILANATQVSSWNLVFASLPSGDFATYITDGDIPTTFTAPWTFNSGVVAPLWVLQGFTFDLTSSSIVTQSTAFLDVRGTGMISGNSFTPTQGTWTFQINNALGSSGANSKFNFIASTAANVPDGGATVALLGLSFLGLGGVSRFVRRK